MKRWSKTLGLFGYTITLRIYDEGDRYGFPDSRGYSIHIVGWKDKKRARTA